MKDFYLERKFGKLVGVTFADIKKSYVGFEYKDGKVNNVVTDKVTVEADGSIVVDLYYDRVEYYLDLNGYLDGGANGHLHINGLVYATADIYINGVNVASGVQDYISPLPYGTKWEIKNINVSPGRQYNGLYSIPNDPKYATSLSGVLERYTTVTLDISTIQYSINYELDGGILPDGVPKTYTVDKEITLPTPTKEGYEFKGWKKEGSNEYVTTIPKGTTGDIHLTAEYSPVVILIEFTLEHEGEGIGPFIKAEQGMNWEEFVNSKYNNYDANLAIDEQGRVYQVGRGCILNVNKNDKIKDMYGYTFICAH